MIKKSLHAALILLITIIFLCFFFLVRNALAWNLGNLPIKVKTRQLPEWCMYTQGQTQYHSDNVRYSQLYQKFIKTYGKGWIHMHHYCYGLDKFNLGFINWGDEQKRNFYFTDAIGEFDYVLSRSDSKFEFKPQVFVSKGRALSSLGNYAGAIITFKQVIQLRPNYAGGYMLIADQFILLGDKDKARAILQVGLTHVPDSPTLKKKLDQIK